MQDDEVRSGEPLFRSQRFTYLARFSPSRYLNSIGIDGNLGEQVDFANSRPGRGGTINLARRESDRSPRGVAMRAATFLGSLLFAYKLNWQSVLFVGYGDDRELSDGDRLERSGRQLFVKLSYAFQR